MEADILEQPAVSHQLRRLRNLRLGADARSGRNAIYSIYDNNHVAQLLDEAMTTPNTYA